MATDRIYGNFQWAGVKVVTSAKSLVNNAGTDAYAPLVGALGIDGATLATGANPVPVQVSGGEGGASTIATAQVTVANTSTLIAATRSGRNAITIVNSGTTPVYIGVTGVTTATGVLLPGSVGAALTLPTTAAVYGVVASSTQAVSYVETY